MAPMTLKASACSRCQTSSRTSKALRPASSLRRHSLPLRSSGKSAASPSSRASQRCCSASCGFWPSVIQKMPSGKARRTSGLWARALASTLLPIPPIPCSPTRAAAPLTSTGFCRSTSSRSRRALIRSGCARKQAGSSGTATSLPTGGIASDS